MSKLLLVKPDKSNRNPSTNLHPTYSQPANSFICKMHAVAFPVLMPLEENIIAIFKYIIIYKYLLKLLMSSVSSLAIICFARECQVKSRLFFLAKLGQKMKVYLAQYSIRWAKGGCCQTGMT